MTASWPTSIPTTAQLRGDIDDNVSTLLSAGINGIVTTIPVDDASEFPSAGLATLRKASGSGLMEVFSYTGKTANSFTGCTRDFNGKGADSYSEDDEVHAYWVADHHNRHVEETIAVAQNMNDRFGTGTHINIPNGVNKTFNGKTVLKSPSVGTNDVLEVQNSAGAARWQADFTDSDGSLNFKPSGAYRFRLYYSGGDMELRIETGDADSAGFISLKNQAGVTHEIGIDTVNESGGGRYAGPASSLNFNTGGSYPIWFSINGNAGIVLDTSRRVIVGEDADSVSPASAETYFTIAGTSIGDASAVNAQIQNEGTGNTSWTVASDNANMIMASLGSGAAGSWWSGGPSRADTTYLQSIGAGAFVFLLSSGDGYLKGTNTERWYVTIGTHDVAEFAGNDSDITTIFNVADDVGLHVYRPGMENDSTHVRIYNGLTSGGTGLRVGYQLYCKTSGSNIGGLELTKYSGDASGTWPCGVNRANTGGLFGLDYAMTYFVANLGDFGNGFVMGSNTSGRFIQFNYNGSMTFYESGSATGIVNVNGAFLGYTNAGSVGVGFYSDQDSGLAWESADHISVCAGAGASEGKVHVYKTQIIFEHSGNLRFQFDTSKIVPYTDNTITNGNATYRWSDVRSVLINGSDYGYANGWIMREYPCSAKDVQSKSDDWMKENAWKGIQVLNKEGKQVARFEYDGTFYANEFKTFDGVSVAQKISDHNAKIKKLEDELRELKEAA